MEETFAKRFNDALTIRGIKPAELSRKTGINESVISQYRIGKYVPKQKRVELLAFILQVSIPWLLGADVPMDIQTADNTPIDEGIALYNKLDEIDKAEIRGEMKHMLRADKYKNITIIPIAARGKGNTSPGVITNPDDFAKTLEEEFSE